MTLLENEKDGRDYCYRIPLTDSRKAKNAIRRIESLDRLGVRFIERNPSEVHTPLGYVSYRTRDQEGPVPNCGKFEYSPAWEPFPSGPGQYEGLEMRNGDRGGTKLRGYVYVGSDDPAIGRYVHINTVVDLTPTEVKTAVGEWMGDDFETLMDAIHWATEDSIEKLREEYHKDRMDALEECDHIFEDSIGHEHWCGKCEYVFMSDELEHEGIDLPETE